MPLVQLTYSSNKYLVDGAVLGGCYTTFYNLVSRFFLSLIKMYGLSPVHVYLWKEQQELVSYLKKPPELEYGAV